VRSVVELGGGAGNLFRARLHVGDSEQGLALPTTPSSEPNRCCKSTTRLEGIEHPSVRRKGCATARAVLSHSLGGVGMICE
jgi:hypothetical protein